MPIAAIAAIVATALLAVLVAFQLALAVGAPLGDMSWGGRHAGVLPTRLRVASAVAGLVLYPLMAVVFLGAGGVIGDEWLPVDPAIAMWILAGFFAIGMIVNAISRSPRERIWSPVSAVIGICAIVLALG